MKRYIKLSLLLLLIPLFATNVYAKEIIDSNISSFQETGQITQEKVESFNEDIKNSDEDFMEDKDNTEQTLNQILEIIDKNYELDLVETDNLKYNENNANSIVQEEIIRQINNKLINNNINLEEFGYRYELIWNYNITEDINSYQLEIYNLDNEILDKIYLNVTYNNSNLKTEEEKNQIEDFLENNNPNITTKYTLEELLENIQNEKDLVPDLYERLTKLFENTGIDFYVLENNKIITETLSGKEEATIVLGKNNIIYKKINIENSYITIIDVPSEEDTKKYVEDYIISNLMESGYGENINGIEYLYLTNEVFITIDNEYKSFGTIEVNKIVKVYNIISGANSTITKDDSLRINTNGNSNEFIKILINSIELNPRYYNIYNDNITIINEFIKALNYGTYNLEIIYKYGRVQTIFNIKNNQNTHIEQAQPQKPVSKPSYPNYNYNYNNSYNYNYDYSVEETTIENESEEEKEEDKQDKDDIELAEDDINIDKLLEVDKDNNKNTDSEAEEDEDDKEYRMTMIKSRYVPIIIVVISVLVGGITAYIYLKNKEDF